MTAFSSGEPFDAVDAHLRCMSEALRPGGAYVLDLTLRAREDEPESTTDEAWEMSRGDVTVRADDDGIVVEDGAERHRLAWGTEGHLRGYTAARFAACVARCPAFVIDSWHPESSRATGVSEFAYEGQPAPPPGGRTMVVLRRIAPALPGP
jgi:hypothetical protein